MGDTKMENAQEETKGDAETPTTEDTQGGDNSKALTLLDKHNDAAKRMEEATKAQREENDRTERILAETKLGGVTNAGQPQKTEKETDEAYTEKFLKGDVDPIA